MQQVPIISVYNLQPHSYKTTTALSLAHEWFQRGKTVLLIDCDPLGSLTKLMTRQTSPSESSNSSEPIVTNIARELSHMVTEIRQLDTVCAGQEGKPKMTVLLRENTHKELLCYRKTEDNKILLLPSDPSLARVTSEFLNMPVSRFRMSLSYFLVASIRSFLKSLCITTLADVIIIDLPSVDYGFSKLFWLNSTSYVCPIYNFNDFRKNYMLTCVRQLVSWQRWLTWLRRIVAPGKLDSNSIPDRWPELIAEIIFHNDLDLTESDNGSPLSEKRVVSRLYVRIPPSIYDVCAAKRKSVAELDAADLDMMVLDKSKFIKDSADVFKQLVDVCASRLSPKRDESTGPPKTNS